MTGEQPDPEWMRAARRLADAALRWAEELPRDGGAHSGDCTGCPVCRSVAAFRAIRPELTEHLTEVVGEFLVAYRQAGDATGNVPADAPVPTPRQVQRIDITD